MNGDYRAGQPPQGRGVRRALCRQPRAGARGLPPPRAAWLRRDRAAPRGARARVRSGRPRLAVQRARRAVRPGGAPSYRAGASRSCSSQLAPQVARLRRSAETMDISPREHATIAGDNQHLIARFSGNRPLLRMLEELTSRALWRMAWSDTPLDFTTRARRQQSARFWGDLLKRSRAGDAARAPSAPPGAARSVARSHDRGDGEPARRLRCGRVTCAAAICTMPIRAESGRQGSGRR